MNSKQVIKEINSVIRPVLIENGFDKFSGQTYWRYLSDRIDILKFKVFKSYVSGHTSFSIHLSTILIYIPSQSEIKTEDEIKKPTEAQGHFRSGIIKDIEQSKLPNVYIWSINNEGSNLSECIADSKNQILKDGFDWFKKFESKENVLRILQNKMDISDTWGFGNLDSPVRNELTAYTAFELGKMKFAIEKLNKVYDFYNEKFILSKSQYYKEKMERTEQEISRIKDYRRTKN